jgi:hypothetical protein
MTPAEHGEAELTEFQQVKFTASKLAARQDLAKFLQMFGFRSNMITWGCRAFVEEPELAKGLTLRDATRILENRWTKVKVFLPCGYLREAQEYAEKHELGRLQP